MDPGRGLDGGPALLREVLVPVRADVRGEGPEKATALAERDEGAAEQTPALGAEGCRRFPKFPPEGSRHGSHRYITVFSNIRHSLREWETRNRLRFPPP